MDWIKEMTETSFQVKWQKAVFNKSNQVISRLQMYNNLAIEAANRIGSAIALNEIPAKYKHLKVLGRGATSIVLEETPDTTLMFTRDYIKKEYLEHSFKAEEVGNYTSYNKTYPKMRELQIYILRMPRLYPLSKENRIKVKSILKIFENLPMHNKKEPHAKIIALGHIVEKYELEFNKPHDLKAFYDFIINYDEEQYHLDLGTRQFLQTKDGRVSNE